jgi:hypothetical protein
MAGKHKQGGITVVDWIDERTSLSGGARWLMFRKCPRAPTGYLLPFDQRAYWATIVANNITKLGTTAPPWLRALAPAQLREMEI